VLLPKGFEIEVYTGTPQGEIVGLSDRIAAELSRFTREPDNRNVEYTTAPCACYDRLLCELVRPRLRLRDYLKHLGDYTLIPGSTLSLGGSDRFYRSDPGNPYHSFIETTYGTKVVTASVHINIGIDDPEVLMRAVRLIRVEAPLYLALSASSPFLDGEVTGSHSTRWQVFPQVPDRVPLFESHGHFIRWTNEQLAIGTMQNVRHLWISVRPNGDNRPYSLNRLELRICDLVTDPIALLAITAFLEARIWQVILDPSLDPLDRSIFSADDLLDVTMANEAAVARHSLAARVRHWQDGREIVVGDWIDRLYPETWDVAKLRGFNCFLSPLREILKRGNVAQQWLKLHQQGLSPSTILEGAISGMDSRDRELEEKLCQMLV